MDYECLMKSALKQMPLFRPMTNPRDVMARYGMGSTIRNLSHKQARIGTHAQRAQKEVANA